MKNACINAYTVEMWVNMICEMGETPFATVDVAETERPIDVPLDFVQNNKIVLNLAPGAVRSFNIDKENGYLTFGARFNKVHQDVSVPCEAIVKINSRDTGVGANLPSELMFFRSEEPTIEVRTVEGEGDSRPSTKSESSECAGHSKPVKRNHLKVVK